MGDLIAVISPSSLTVSRLLYASLYLGVAVFPLDPNMSKERRDRLLTHSGVGLVFTDLELDDLPFGLKTVLVSSVAGPDSVVESAPFNARTQLVIATSGSEGEPKGVMLSGDNIAASIAASRSRLGLKPNDIWLNSLPMFHIGGAMILYRCLEAGAAMLLHQGFSAKKVWADLKRYRVSHLSLVPAMLLKLLDVANGAPPPESLRVALIGGGHLSSELAARAHAAGWPLCVSYGMSETCSQCVTDYDEHAGLIPGYVGLPLEGFELDISDNGRIKVRGHAVMGGYLNPEQSSGVGLTRDGWFETGDLGELDQAGGLRVLGRADDVLVSGGNTIHPVEIESLMISCPGVVDVAISSRTDMAWGDMLVALYVGATSKDEIESWCRANLSSKLRPREFIQLAELPRNSMGKLDRKGVSLLLDQL